MSLSGAGSGAGSGSADRAASDRGGPFALAAGRVVGRYTVLEPLGAGARFEVYRARLAGVLGFEKDVALKLPSALVRADARALAALVARMKAATALSHAALLQVVDLGQLELDGEATPFFVTELARGVTLRAALSAAESAARRVPLGAVCAALAQIAQTVDYVAQRGLGAAAVRAEDVFVSPQGDLKLKDFCLVEGAADAPLLGALARDLCKIAQGVAPPALSALLERLLSGTATDAGAVSEELLEIAFAASPDPEQRDLALLARVEAPAAAPALSFGELSLASASSVVVACAADVAARLAELAPDGRPLAREDDGVALHGLALTSGDEQPLIELLRKLLAHEEVGRCHVDLVDLADPAAPEACRARARAALAAPPGGPGPEHAARVTVSAAVAPFAQGAFVLGPPDAEGRRALRGESRAPSGGRFVGRARELEALARAIAGTSAGGARLLSVAGPAGIGKTRLCRELLRRIPEDRVGFAWVTCGRGAELAALGGVAAILRALLSLPAHAPLRADDLVAALRVMGLGAGAVASLARVLGVSVPFDERPPSSHDALIDLLGAVRLGRPFAVLLDDAQELDPASASVLSALVASERARQLPVLFVLIERGAAGADGLSVGDLDDDDLAGLIAARLGARLLPPELFELVAQRVGGHPALVEEVVRELTELALVEVRGGVAVLLPPPGGSAGKAPLLLESRAKLLRARVERLSGAARSLLAVLSYLPEGAEPAALAAVTGLAPELVGEAAIELERQAMVRRDEQDRLFSASIFADVAREAAPVEPHAIHARLGALFAGRGEPGRAATHWELAGEGARAGALWRDAAKTLEAEGHAVAALDAALRGLRHLALADEAVDAVRRVARLAPASAELLLDAEVELADALSLIDAALPEDARDALRLELARALARGGAVAAAESLVGQVEPRGRDALEARLAVAALARDPRIAGDVASHLFADGPEAPAARAAHDASAAEAGPAAALLDAVEVALLAGDLGVAGRLLERVELEGGLRAALLRSQFALAGGDADGAHRHFELAHARVAAAPHAVAARALLWGARLARSRGQTSRAFALLSEAQRAARRTPERGLAELVALELEVLERGVPGDLDARMRRAQAEGRHHDAVWLGLGAGRGAGETWQTAHAFARETQQLGALLLAAQLAL